MESPSELELASSRLELELLVFLGISWPWRWLYSLSAMVALLPASTIWYWLRYRRIVEIGWRMIWARDLPGEREGGVAAPL